MEWDERGQGGGVNGGGLSKKCAKGMVLHGLVVSVRCVCGGWSWRYWWADNHAALYKNRLFVAAIYKRRDISVAASHAPYKDTYCNRALSRVPACVENLLVEVQRLELHGILQRGLDPVLGRKLLVTR